MPIGIPISKELKMQILHLRSQMKMSHEQIYQHIHQYLDE